ncbi:MAG: ATPase, T2SS/T4P/T4SS family [Elusimicrobiales bacterium]|jgi:type IV pilus assembly protein PilB
METVFSNDPVADANAMFGSPQSCSPANARPSPAASPAAGLKTVLVVDDNKDYRELIKHLLTVNHYRVLEAGDGAQALSIINTAGPDLALVDFNMPKMNGYELIQEVRSNFETRKLRIIMFTGAVNRQHLKTLDMDIADFLEKPVSNAKLLESIARALNPGRAPAPEKKQVPTVRSAEASPGPPPRPAALSIERFEPAEAAPEVRPGEAMLRQGGPPPEASVPERAKISLPEEAGALAGPSVEFRPPAESAPTAPVPEIDELLAEDAHELEILDSVSERKEEQQDAQGLENLTNDSPLIQRVNKILMAAVGMRASDIHIEPNENRVIVRVRVDGVLKQLTTLPISIHPRLTARIKIMSSLVITEKRLPQDGQFRVQIRGQKIEFRVSTLPCIKGEKIVLRILGQSKLNTSLSQLDMSDRELKASETALKSPNGLVLVTGPTGSGKTTTLYTMINVLNRPDVNIMTAEDPVEYEVPNINQVKIRPSVGLTFESTLRAFLRQDPDIMLVGEIRDLETAEIAIKASITGHLVFSTLHTNSAPATVVRMTHMGVAPYLLAASVKLVIAQRLVRTLCPRCKAPGRLTDENRKFLTDEEAGRLRTVYHAVGCPDCNQGYSGRKAVFEVMPVESSAMRQLIITGRDVDALSELAVSEGMTSLRQSTLNAVINGHTSIQEALKIMMG